MTAACSNCGRVHDRFDKRFWMITTPTGGRCSTMCRKCWQSRRAAKIRANPRKRIAALWYTHRKQCKQSGIPFSVSKEELIQKVEQTDYCELCGTRLEKKPGFTETQYQIDRRIPNLGYVLENIGILCRKCNRMKSDATLEWAKKLLGYLEGAS